MPGYAEGRVLHQEHSTSKMDLHPVNTECSVLLLVKRKKKKRKEKKKKGKNERKKIKMEKKIKK